MQRHNSLKQVLITHRHDCSLCINMVCKYSTYWWNFNDYVEGWVVLWTWVLARLETFSSALIMLMSWCWHLNECIYNHAVIARYTWAKWDYLLLKTAAAQTRVNWKENEMSLLRFMIKHKEVGNFLLFIKSRKNKKIIPIYRLKYSLMKKS